MQTNLQQTCNQIDTDVVSRKAVRAMVAAWHYDMAEWEDVQLALHDVDELPPAGVEVRAEQT